MMGKPWGSVGFVSEGCAPFDDADLEAIVPIVPNVPGVALPAFDDERDVLDADDWDDLETAAWLAQPSWASIRGDDPLDPFA